MSRPLLLALRITFCILLSKNRRYGGPGYAENVTRVLSIVIVPCPVCRGTGRNPEAPAAIADDDGTCLVCCSPLHPWYAAWHGQARIPPDVLVAALAGLDDDASR